MVSIDRLVSFAPESSREPGICARVPEPDADVSLNEIEHLCLNYVFSSHSS